ncbi:PH domain-containing protein, partial [Aneurinibacillus aneurinilyticus]|uniref:PH domain-containing protein n=1 Tax=Aneurinibacillus aneurinilyticus TaxID=1391 RepID=UPI003526640E
MRSDILTIYNQYGFLAKGSLDGFIPTLDNCVANDEKVMFIAPGKHTSRGIWSITDKRIIFIGTNHMPASFPFSQIQKVERKKPFLSNFKLFFWFQNTEIDMKIDDNKNLMAAFDIVSEKCENQAEIINMHKTSSEKYEDYIQEQEQKTKNDLLSFSKDYLGINEKEIMSIKGYYEAKFSGFDSALDGI